MFYFLAFNSGLVLSGNAFRYNYTCPVTGIYRFCVLGLVCMAHRIICLIPTCKNTCGRNNTKTTFLEIFFIGYHFITARKVSTAIYLA